MEKFKNFFRSEKGQVIIALSVALLLLAATYTSVFLFQNRDLVFAEELTDNAILNFNQLLDLNYRSFPYSSGGLTLTKNGNLIHVSGTNSATVWIPVSDTISISNNSKLYVASQYLYDDIKKTVSDGAYIMTSGTTYHFYLRLLAGTYDLDISLNVIDLTQMFGSGNEPATVVDVKKYLPLDYYNYSLGTPVSFDSLSSFMDGYSSALGLYGSVSSISLNSSLNYANSFGYNGSSFSKLTDGTNFVYNLSNPDDYVAFPLLVSLPVGTRVKVEFYSILIPSVFGFSNSNLYRIGNPVVDSSVSSLTVDTITFNNYYYLEFVSSSVLDTLYLSGNVGSIFANVVITYSLPENLDGLIASSYSNGYDDGKNYYIKNELPAIKNNEYYRGKQDGIQSANEYSFISLFSALFDAPVKVLTGLLDFDVLGMNLKSFFFSLFTIFLVLALVNFIMAKRGDNS